MKAPDGLRELGIRQSVVTCRAGVVSGMYRPRVAKVRSHSQTGATTQSTTQPCQDVTTQVQHGINIIQSLTCAYHRIHTSGSSAKTRTRCAVGMITTTATVMQKASKSSGRQITMPKQTTPHHDAPRASCYECFQPSRTPRPLQPFAEFWHRSPLCCFGLGRLAVVTPWPRRRGSCPWGCRCSCSRRRIPSAGGPGVV